MVQHVRVKTYDADNDLAEFGFFVSNVASQLEIEDLIAAVMDQSALQVRSYDVTKELDITGIDGKESAAVLSAEPFADDKQKLTIEFQSATSKTVTKTTVPGPKLTGSGVSLQNNGRVAVPGSGAFATLITAILANCTDRAGEALSGVRRAYLDMQRGRRGLG